MTSSADRWPARKVRETFLDFFRERGHSPVPSSSVVPFNDPSLLFVNAGMNQYKPVFLGTADPSSELAYLKRATNSQKCIRAGGKHNDLDDVGKDSYHHTFFEMLGSWSFGDYFKKQAIEYAWELLTTVYCLDPNRLYVTYFEGNASSGLGPDNEAKELCRSVGVANDHIVPGNMKDNFWEMGDQGPCGPCIELHYDRIGGRNAAHLVNQDDPNVIEIWNIVFIQFNREADKSLTLLPNKHIDTGLGFERLLSVLQDKPSNYDTDLFIPLFEKIREITGVRPYKGNFGANDTDGIDTAYRVVADHVRTSTIAIADGVVPANVGRGYVIRRILRRGARYGRKYLNAEIGSFFSKIVPTVVEQIGYLFPEIQRKEQDVKETLDEEERSFALTLDRGEVMFNKFAQDCRSRGSKDLAGADVWRLYDTYGFPIDLTTLMAEEHGLRIDNDAVSAAQHKAREASKGVKSSATDLLTLDVHGIAALEGMSDVPTTNDRAKFEKGVINATVKAIYFGKEFLNGTTQIPNGEQFGILLDSTNFYAESGGQEHDTGRLVIDGIAEIHVTNVQSYGGYVLHIGYLKYGFLSVGDGVIAEYDELRRQPIRSNHTGTHILNFALREILGNELEQKGSLVTPEKLRFDFSLKAGITDEELRKIEAVSSKYISDNKLVFASDVDLKTARMIEGVRAVFGETYPDPVRVVSIGVAIDKLVSDVTAKDWWKYSIEFCGGTHVERTGEIKDLVVLEESSIAKGVRRIVAVTGRNAWEARQTATSFEKERLIRLERMPFSPEKETLVKEVQVELSKLTISALVKKDFTKRFERVAKDTYKGQKEAHKAQVDAALELASTYFKQSKAHTTLVAQLPSNASAKVVSDAIKQLATKENAKSVYLIGVDSAAHRIAHGCFVAPEHISKGLDANEWTARVADVLGGNSGGSGSVSIGSGVEVEKVNEAMETATQHLKKLNI